MLDLLAFLKWYLALLACGLLAWPLAFKFFRRLPDRGYTFAKPLGVLVIYYVFWLLGSLGLLANDVGGQVVAALVVLGLGLAWLKGEGVGELRDWLRAQRRFALAVEAFFLLALAAMAWARAYNPDILATEKPMEFMFINSILRSPAFPPHDAWLAGHAISYYYFGYVMVASLARLTAVPSAYAFNLGLAMLFALTAVGALGVTLNLIALASKEQEGRRQRDRERDIAKQYAIRNTQYALLPSFWPALLGPLLVLVVGNFYGVLALAHANRVLADLQIPAVWYDFGKDAGGGARCSLADSAGEPGVRVGKVNLWKWLDVKGVNTLPPAPPVDREAPLQAEKFNWDPRFWWWFSGARVVHDCNLSGVETEAIDEMPAFSFILGDMHPHVLALPFVVLAVALALEWLLDARGRGQATEDMTGLVEALRGLQGAARQASLLLVAPDRLLLAGVILGGLSFLNTWDFPMYWFVTAAALTVGVGLRWGWEGLLQRWRAVGLTALTLGVLSVLLYLPFFLVFQSQASGILPNLIYPTRFQQTFVMFGPALVGVTLFVGWLVFRWRSAIDRRAAWWAGGGIVAVLIFMATALALGGSLNPDLLNFVDRELAPLTRSQALGLLLQRRLVDSLATLFPAALVGLSVGLGVGALRCSPLSGSPVAEDIWDPLAEVQIRATRFQSASPVMLRSPAVLMALIMTLTGALLLLGPEYVYLRDNFGTRMNTIFKFYFQVWVLWALVAAFGAWYLWRHAGRRMQWLAGGLLGLALLGGLVYTVAGLYSKADHFANPPTLNGMAYFERDYPHDWAAIQWLQQNARLGGAAATPVIAEGIGGQYWIEGRFSRISMATGLPTVMGWPGHEGQWRGQYIEKVAEREGRIRELYQTRDWQTAQAILDAYHIEYVVVSSLEQAKYQDLQSGKKLERAKFDRFMRVVFQSGDVTIYQHPIVP